MALPEVAYADYQAWGGKLGKDAFDASAKAAAARVRYVIGYNEPDGEAEEAAYRNAVCAAVDVDAAYGASGGIGEGAGSIRIGSFSIGEAGRGGSASQGMGQYDRDMLQAIRGELIGTPLLYQGVG